MSLTCNEEFGRVGRGRDDDASDLSATSRACQSRGIWRTTRHTDKRAALHTAEDRRPTDQSGKRVACWTGKSPDTRDTLDILVASSRGFACVGRVDEDVTRMLRGTAPVEFKL